jgi:N-acylneuraminate cytidylyltransferase
MNVLAIIPARGGSKTIPRKNIRPLAGHPLIAYSIAAALQATSVSRVIVSTDDEEIAAIARQYGAETPFLRPAEYSQDSTTDFPVFTHALKWLSDQENYHADVVVQLRPTSPVRPPDLVEQAVQLLVDHPEADSVRGVVPSGQNPYKMWRINPTGRMVPLLQVEGLLEPYNSPRQALPQTYWQTGHIDAIRTSVIFEKNSLSGDTILPLVIDGRYTIDIDSLKDWEQAEALIALGELPMVKPAGDTGRADDQRRTGAGEEKRPLPSRAALVVFDFDGVMTDDRVWIDQHGNEMVAANRSDGMGIAMLRRAGIQAVVISTETNPVVAARCQKLNIPALQGLADKALALENLLLDRQVDPAQVVYLGNDVNDLSCFPLVGCAVAVADAHPDVLSQADMVLTRGGGFGAVRELCDLLLKTLNNQRGE